MVMTAEAACGANAVLSQCLVRHDGVVGWLEHAPEAGGQQIFCYCLESDTVRLLNSGVSIRSSVNGYGARAWCFAKDGIVYVDEATQQLCYWAVFDDASPRRITAQTGARYSEPLSLVDGRMVAIEEWRGVHRVVAFDAHGSRQVLREGDDFYAGLALGPAGRLSWISWQHPQQPWTETSLWWARITEQGLEDIECLREAHSSVQMPSFDADGRLYFLDDCAGFWQLYRYQNRSIETCRQPSADLANAPWQSGYLLYGYDDQKRLWTTQFESSGVRLFCDDEPCQLPSTTLIRELVVHQDQLIMIHAGPRCIGQISRFHQGVWHTLWHVPMPEAARLDMVPKHKIFDVHGQAVSGYWYGTSSQGEATALLINLHGGPTSATYPVYNPLFQFWNDQGFAILDINYRGSSNQGRDYRMQLKHQWGLLEVDDIFASIAQLIDEGLVDADKIFIRGRSSGGYSVLMALLDSDVFCAAGVYFGVSDPARLHARTHKFESHYLPWLLGNMDEADPMYRARVPALRAQDIQSPVIFFQGLQDAVVTPEQTASMAAAIQAAGGHAETLYFANEGHGFRQPQNTMSALQAELAFYRQAMISRTG